MGNLVWLLWAPIVLIVLWDVVRDYLMGPSRRKPYKNKPDPYADLWGNEWNERLQSFEKDNPRNL